ncbi:MAG: efflux RND transporter permease subunit, partial [Candidatus Cloacimonadaceae bacterium]
MKVAETAIKYSILINLLVIAIVILGIYSMVSLPREEFPAVEFGRVLVITVYPGVSAEEMEQLVTNKVETELNDLPNLDTIQGFSEEGRSTVSVSFDTSVDSEEAYDLVSREMSKITDLPDDALDPIIVRLAMRELNPIAQVVIGGDFQPLALRELAEDLKDGILRVDNISKVELVGARDHQIWVDVDQARIDAYGLSLSDISAVLQGRNLNIPGGTANYGKSEFLVRALGQFNSTDEIGRMIITSDASGRAIRISDVATVRDTLSKTQTKAKLNGQEGISIFLYKQGDGNIIKVMEDVRAYIAEFEKTHPGSQISVRNDGSIDVKNGIGALSRNALMGIILVFVTLFLFLGWRNAAFAATGIPIALLITFIVIPLFNITLNNLTIFGLIIVVGMVVDNSVVVLENIHRYRELGFDHKSSISEGVNQVISPVFASTLTTVAAFMPMLLTGGIIGQFLSVFPIVVTIALLASWFQAMVILPTNIHQFGHRLVAKEDRTTKLIRPLNKFYRRIIIKALHRRGLVIGAVVLLLILSFLVLGSGAIPFEFFPSSLSQTIQLELTTPVGTSLEETDRIVTLVEQHILSMKQKDDIEFVVSNVGSLSSEGLRENKTSNAAVSIDLVPLKEMRWTQEEIKTEIRRYLDTLPGLYTYKFGQSQAGPPIGQDIDIRIKGESLERLAYLGDVVKTNLKKIPGVEDIDDSFDEGKMEARIRLDQEKLSMYKLSVAQVASAIRMASTGSEVTQFRGNGVDEIPILVKLDDRYTQELEALKNLKVRNPLGSLIAIRDLASFEISSSISRIGHYDGNRVISVTAAVGEYSENGKTRKRTTSEVVNLLMGDRLRGTKGMLSSFEQRFPGYTMEFGGIREQQTESYTSLAYGFLIALLAIFAILASQFRSYVQPLIVMATIPFAFIGVVFGLLVTGLSFSLNTMLSVVALAGVVVNANIVLIDTFNQLRRDGIPTDEAALRTGAQRLRPVLLTSVTTVLALVPMVFGLTIDFVGR